MVNSFTILVLDENDPPVALKSIPDQNITLGKAIAIQLPNPLFSDEDAGDSISFGLSLQDATKLPVWMIFDAQTLQITGIPTGSEAKTLNLIVTATDRAGAKAFIPCKIIEAKPSGYIDSMTSKIMVFHNPTAGIITLLVTSDFRVSPFVDVYDYNGSKFGQVRLTLDPLNRQKAMVDLSALPNGLYMLRFIAGNKVFVEKVMVIRKR